MKVALISPYSDISSLGVRSLSACLKEAGHETILIFLPQVEERCCRNTMTLRYSEKLLDEVAGLCEGVDLVGISLMTNYFERGVQLTQHLKYKLEVPISWGGVHPTVRPEESLDYADIVCIGEAEETLVEIIDKMEDGDDISAVNGAWFKRNEKIIRNPIRPLNDDLDSLPLLDYDLTNHFVLKNQSLIAMTPELLGHFLSQHVFPGIKGIPCYQTITSRGCPYGCSYCCNHMYQSLYRGQKYLRRRSATNLIDELKYIKTKFDFVGAMLFSDDTIFAAAESEIEEFSRLYKREIQLPFYCLGHPATITEKKMHDLIDAGLKSIQIGVETASKSTKKLYKRNVSNEKMLSTVRTVSVFRDRIFPPIYDIIVDNPYETVDDLLETIHFVLKFPKPYELNLFSLVLFPGTELYQKALHDGYLKDEVSQIYRKGWIDREQNYINLLFSLLRRRRLPRVFVRILADKRVVKVLNGKGSWLVKWLYNLIGSVRKRKKTFIDNCQ